MGWAGGGATATPLGPPWHGKTTDGRRRGWAYHHRMWFLLLAGCEGQDVSAPVPFSGAVVAVQGDAAMAFLDEEGELVDTLDLRTEVDGVPILWMIHNVQITPDGGTAIATAMPPMDNTALSATLQDQLVVVDLENRVLQRRCDLGYGLGIAHVVTDGTLAWATAYGQDRVVVVDLASCKTLDRWPLPPGTRPHGIRRGGEAFYVAGLGDGSLHRLSAATGEVQSWDLPGLAIQVAVLPDGSAVLATLQDTRQVARLDLQTEAVTVFDLPEGSVGPAQIYPTPDSSAVWVADQGSMDGLMAGRELYRLDARTGETTARVFVHDAPHGVVVSADGSTVWTTTLTMGTVDRVDVDTLALESSTAVGNYPNGISLGWDSGAMP